MNVMMNGVYAVTLFGFMPLWAFITLLIIIGLGVGLFFLSRYAKKLEKRSQESQEQMRMGAQTVSMLIIDKKRMKMKEAGLPPVVLEQTPKRFHNTKVPIAKVKIGPTITNMMCDEKIFDLVPVRKEVKATVNGIYIMGVKGLRGGLEQTPEKKSFLLRMREKTSRKLRKLDEEEKAYKEAKQSAAKEKAAKKAAKKASK